MSRSALWPAAPERASAPVGPSLPGSAQIPTSAPIVAQGATGRAGTPRGAGGPVSPRTSGHAGRVLARIADLHERLAEAHRELVEVLAVPPERALMSDVMPERLLTVRDVAERLSLSDKTVRRLRRRGELPPGIEVAGTIRWRPEEIEKWLGKR